MRAFAFPVYAVDRNRKYPLVLVGRFQKLNKKSMEKINPSQLSHLQDNITDLGKTLKSEKLGAEGKNPRIDRHRGQDDLVPSRNSG